MASDFCKRPAITEEELGALHRKRTSVINPERMTENVDAIEIGIQNKTTDQMSRGIFLCNLRILPSRGFTFEENLKMHYRSKLFVQRNQKSQEEILVAKRNTIDKTEVKDIFCLSLKKQ